MAAVSAFPSEIPADTDAWGIERTAVAYPRLGTLDLDDRELARALLRADDPPRVRTYNGHLLANGQHRICAARIAGATDVPVWFDHDTAQPPTNAQQLQTHTVGGQCR